MYLLKMADVFFSQPAMATAWKEQKGVPRKNTCFVFDLKMGNSWGRIPSSQHVDFGQMTDNYFSKQIGFSVCIPILDDLR